MPVVMLGEEGGGIIARVVIDQDALANVITGMMIQSFRTQYTLKRYYK
jgi:hypothetical protein